MLSGFIAALNRDRFDDTEWRKTGLLDGDVETWRDRAMDYAHTLDRTDRRGSSNRPGRVSGMRWVLRLTGKG